MSANWVMLSFVGVGFLLVAVSLPLVLNKVKPNPIYGVRLPKCYLSDRNWYAANAYGGRQLLVVGVVTTTATLTLYCIPTLPAHTIAYTIACEAVMMVGVLWAVVAILIFVNRL